MGSQDWEKRVLQMFIAKIVMGMVHVVGQVADGLAVRGYLSRRQWMVVMGEPTDRLRAMMLVYVVEETKKNGMYQALKDQLIRYGATTSASYLVDEIEAPGPNCMSMRVAHDRVFGFRAGLDYGHNHVVDFSLEGYVNPQAWVPLTWNAVMELVKLFLLCVMLVVPGVVYIAVRGGGWMEMVGYLIWLVVMTVVKRWADGFN